MRRFLAAVFCCVVLLLQGCEGERVQPKFKVGDIVQLAITRERVQITKNHFYGMHGVYYYCRVSGRATGTMVGSQSRYDQYFVKDFWEFELREIDE